MRGDTWCRVEQDRAVFEEELIEILQLRVSDTGWKMRRFKGDTWCRVEDDRAIVNTDQ